MKATCMTCFVVLLVLGLAGCSSTSVTTDWDRTVDFSQYKSFRILQEKEPAPNPLMRDRVEAAVSRELQAKGLLEVEHGADLLVAIHGHGSVHRRVDVDYYGYGYRWRGWGMGHSSARVTDIPMGTLMVDLVDAQHKELEWRGTATDTVDRDPNRTWAKLEKAIAKMFYGFPPQP